MHEEIIIPIAGMMIPIILVPTILVLRHSQQRREWEHKERMRAMDLGLNPASGSRSTFWPTLAVIAIGAVVPVGAFLFTWLTSVMTQANEDIWPAAGGVGTVAVISGSILAYRLIGTIHAASAAAEPPTYAKPPQFDPDAYDTVGRRG